MAKKKAVKQPAMSSKILKGAALIMSSLFLIILCAGFGAGYYFFNKYAKDLPDVASLKDYKPSLVTKIYDTHGELAAEYFVEKRVLVKLDEIPIILRQATLAVEDTAFYEHHGLNIEGIARAFIANMEAGKVVQGGSSITQQLAKTLMLTPERTMDRKIREAILSIKIDKEYSKDEILEIYLNQIYYGHGAYGVQAAAHTYFGKDMNELTISEVALMVGLPKAPSNYSPYRDLERALQRRNHAFERMVAEGVITQDQMVEAAAEPVELAGLKKPVNNAPWFTEHVRRYLEKNYGAEQLYRAGLTVHTTLDLTLQGQADEAVRFGLEKTDKRLGYRGPVGSLDIADGVQPEWAELNPGRAEVETGEDYYLPGLKLKGYVLKVDKNLAAVGFEDDIGYIALDKLDWAHRANPKINAKAVEKVTDARTVLKPGDIVEVKILEGDRNKKGALPLALEQTPVVQGALLAMDPKTGHVKAMVGGYDPEVSKFNRAVQAMRQPGSSFKPFIYSAALDKGYNPASIIIDSPITFNKAITQFQGWKPVNFEKRFYGPTTLRTAVTHSRNIVTIKLLHKIGVHYAADYIQRFGITSPLDINLGLALGASPVSLFEMVYAYGALANGGMAPEPVFITSIENSDGEILEQNEPSSTAALSPSTAFLMANIMKNVVKEGTARAVGNKFKRPIAGKTGTTNNYIDAWFIGFTPSIVCGVWVGNDDNTPMGILETGSRVAIPVWARFMEKAFRSVPASDFVAPSNIVFARINKHTGKLTSETDENSIFEAFVDGDQPTEHMSEESDGSAPGLNTGY